MGHCTRKKTLPAPGLRNRITNPNYVQNFSYSGPAWDSSSSLFHIPGAPLQPETLKALKTHDTTVCLRNQFHSPKLVKVRDSEKHSIDTYHQNSLKQSELLKGICSNLVNMVSEVLECPYLSLGHHCKVFCSCIYIFTNSHCCFSHVSISTGTRLKCKEYK